MRFEKGGVHYNRKFNLGNYESADISADMWASCEEGDDIGEVFDTLFAVAKEMVKNNVPPSYKKHTPNYEETFTKYGQKVDKSELIASIDDDSDLVDDSVDEIPY